MLDANERQMRTLERDNRNVSSEQPKDTDIGEVTRICGWNNDGNCGKKSLGHLLRMLYTKFRGYSINMNRGQQGSPTETCKEQFWHLLLEQANS
jgi:hypothetical protein